jgi:LPXTG-motif cell wall-anchored protein
VYTGGGLSSQTLEVTMHDVPDAPTNLAVVSGNGSLQVTFTPGSDRGAEILNYEYSVNDGDDWTAVSPGVQSSPITIGGLTNATTYQVKLRAINAIGTGESSEAISGRPVAPSVPTTEPEGTTPPSSNPNDSTTTTLPTTVPAPREEVVLELPAAATPLIADTSLSLGAPVVMEFGGFVPGEFVQLIVASTPRVIGSGYADSEGKIRLTGTLPSDLSVGEHNLALFAPESGRGIRQPITVEQSLLPATGKSFNGQVWVVLMLLVFGSLLVIMTRRRRI